MTEAGAEAGIVERVCVELSLGAPGTQVAAIQVYGRATERGQSGLVGPSVGSIEGSLHMHPAAQVYRVMWSVLLLIAPPSSPSVIPLVSEVLQRVRSAEIESRAIGCVVDGPRNTEWLDEFLGDLSLRHNFGSFQAEALWRMIDGWVV